MDRNLPALVVVTGLPCSGKTSLARSLARQLSLPLIAKDTIKESLFTSLGWKDRDWSQQLGQATYALLFQMLEEFLFAKVSLIVESNFHPEQAESKFREIQVKAPFYPLQVNCYAEGRVLVDRFLKRTGQRHPGHVDSEILGDIQPELEIGHLPPLELGGTVIEVDTTDFSRVNVSIICAKLRVAINWNTRHGVTPE